MSEIEKINNVIEAAKKVSDFWQEHHDVNSGAMELLDDALEELEE